MELVEPEPAVADVGGSVGGLPYLAEWYGKVDPWQGANIGGTAVLRYAPATSVSSVASESYRPNGLCHHLRNFGGNLGTINLSVP